MGLREKVALLIILGVACTLCMPKTLKKSALKQYLKNFKKTKYNRGFSPLPRQVFKQSNYERNINNNEYQNHQINKVVNFPEIEYPKISNILRPYEPGDAPYENIQNNDLVDQTRQLNNLRKEAKLKYKIEKAIQKNRSNSTRYGSKLSADPDSCYFKDIGTYPEVQYPLSVAETWKPTFWNYKHFVDQSGLPDDFRESKKCIMEENTSPSSNNQNLDKMSPELQSRLREKVKTAVLKYILENAQNLSISTISKYVDDTISLPLLNQILQKNMSEVNKPRMYRNSQPHTEENRLPITTDSSLNTSENEKETTNTVSLNLKKESTTSKNQTEDINTVCMLEEADDPLSYVKSKSNESLSTVTIDPINEVIDPVVGTTPALVSVDFAVDFIPTTTTSKPPVDITTDVAMEVATPQRFSSTYKTTNQRIQTSTTLPSLSGTPSTCTLTIPDCAMCTDSPHIVATSHSADIINTQDPSGDIQTKMMLANTACNTNPQTALSANVTCLGEPCVLTFSSEDCKRFFKRILSTCSLTNSKTTSSPLLLKETQHCSVVTTDNLVSNNSLNMEGNNNASMIPIVSSTSPVITSVPGLQNNPLNCSTSTPDHPQYIDSSTSLDTPIFQPQFSNDLFNELTIVPDPLLPCYVPNSLTTTLQPLLTTESPTVFKTTSEPFISTNTSTECEITKESTLLNNNSDNTVILSTPFLPLYVSTNSSTISKNLISYEPAVNAATNLDPPDRRDSLNNSVMNPAHSLSEYSNSNVMETLTPILLNDKIDKFDTTPAPLVEIDSTSTLKPLGPNLESTSRPRLIYGPQASVANTSKLPLATSPTAILKSALLVDSLLKYLVANLPLINDSPNNAKSSYRPVTTESQNSLPTDPVPLTNLMTTSTPAVTSDVPITSKTVDSIINHAEILPKTTNLCDTFELKLTSPMPSLYDSGISNTSLSSVESCINPTTMLSTANPMITNSFTPHDHADPFTEFNTIYDDLKPLNDRLTDDMTFETTTGPKSTDFQTDLFEQSPNLYDPPISFASTPGDILSCSADQDSGPPKSTNHLKNNFNLTFRNFNHTIPHNPLLITETTSSSIKGYEPPISVDPPSSLSSSSPGIISNNLVSSNLPNILASEFKPSSSHAPQSTSTIATSPELPTASKADLKSPFVADTLLTCLTPNISLPLSNVSPNRSRSSSSLVTTESQITSTSTPKPYLEPLINSILITDVQNNISTEPRPLMFSDSSKSSTSTMESLLSTISSNNSLTISKPTLLNNQSNIETTREIAISTTAAETSDDDVSRRYSSEAASPILITTLTPDFEDTVHVTNLNNNYGNSKAYNDRLTSGMIPSATSTPSKDNLYHTPNIMSSNLVLDAGIMTATPSPLFITSSIPFDNSVSLDSLNLANPAMEDMMTTKSPIKGENLSVTTPTPVAEGNTDSVNSVDTTNISSAELTRYRKNVEDDYALMLADIIESAIEQCLSDIIYDEIDYENGDYTNSSVDNYDTKDVSATITSAKSTPSLTINSSESLTNGCERESDTNSTSHIDEARNTSIREVESTVPYTTTVDNYILTHPSMIAVESPTTNLVVSSFLPTGSTSESTTISTLPIASSISSSVPSESSEDTLDNTPTPTSIKEQENDELSLGMFKKSLLKALDIVIMKLKF